MPDILLKVTKLEATIGSIEKRLDTLAALTEDVHSLALSIAKLAEQQNNTAQKVSSLSDDVKELKGKPEKHWEAVVAAIISAAVGAFITFLIKSIFIKFLIIMSFACFINSFKYF